MSELVALITTVWTPAGTAVAAIAGLMLGVLVLGYLATLPTYVSEATPLEAGGIVVLASSLAGAVFYAGQIVVAVGADDVPDRLVSRYGLWVLYSVAMGAGTWARLAWALYRRGRHVHEQAVTEVQAEVEAAVEAAGNGH